MFAVLNNASISNRGDVNIPTTKSCLRVLQVLYREGLIRGYTYNQKRTNIYLKYTGSRNKPVMRYIQGIGKPVCLKVLAKLAHANELFILSTPKGVLTLKEALAQNTGGVLFCKII